MSDILDEIKDAIAEKRLHKVLGISTIALFGLGVIIIIYLGISSWHQNKKAEIIQQDGALLTESVNSINTSYFKTGMSPESIKQSSEKTKEYVSKLESLAERNSSPYSALANFYLASISLMEGNHSKATYYYQRVAADNYDKTLKEYAQLVGINTKIGNDKSLYDSISKQIQEYFDHYAKDGKVGLEDKKFSNAMALTGLGIADKQNDQKSAAIYLKALQEKHVENEHINFIVDLASQYYKSKNDSTKQPDGTE